MNFFISTHGQWMLINNDNTEVPFWKFRTRKLNKTSQYSYEIPHIFIYSSFL